MRHLKKIVLLTIISVCALESGAQTLSQRNVALADSVDYYVKKEQWTDAERVLITMLRNDPANKSNYLIWGNLGSVRNNMEHYDEAIEALTIGLSTAPHSTVLLNERANSFLRKGDTAQALIDLDTALQTDSTLQWSRKIRGMVRGATGDLAGAESDLQYYIDNFGREAGVLEIRGDIEASRGNINEAIDYYRESNQIEPDPDVVVKACGLAYLEGDMTSMAEDIRNAIEQYPRNGELYLMRAMLNKSLFQNTAAESDLKIAKELGVDERLIQRYLNITPSGTEKKGQKN